MESPPSPARVSTFDIEGQPVRLIETDDGHRVWLCDCAKSQERAKRHPEGYCGHIVVAIARCIDDGLIEIRWW